MGAVVPTCASSINEASRFLDSLLVTPKNLDLHLLLENKSNLLSMISEFQGPLGHDKFQQQPGHKDLGRPNM
jgi:hypothetical protein